jgi:predicted regulator of Ras-like GTPase activity (Roadblock/LC7/MglB family)
MTTQKDFSEIQEAAKLISVLLRHEHQTATSAASGSDTALQEKIPAPEQLKPETTGFRGDRIEKALQVMCKRGDFTGAVIADVSGLPIAAYNSPVSTNALAAFTSVLGTALEKAAHLLEQNGADNISMDINYADKVVLRRFNIKGLQYYLMVICPQNIDERSEIELSLEQIITILS